MVPVRFYLSDEGDPWFNLALENYIFRTMDPSIPTLFLWRNRPVVVLGRYQNPWVECQLKAMREDHVNLARRQSGGGTVYHDWGNLNFTFLAGHDIYHDRLAFHIILESLKEFGIEGEISERNDLIIRHQGIMKKFSGSAYRKLNDRSFHHGTLLLDTDLTKLQRYLSPMDKKMQAKGVKSVRSPVVNLSEINPLISHDQLSLVIKEKLETHFGKTAVTQIWNKESVTHRELFRNEYNSLISSAWIYGKTPPFFHYLHGYINKSRVSAILLIKEGRIVDFETEHPLLNGYKEHVNKLLSGIPYESGCVEEKLSDPELKKPVEKVLPKEISQFIIDNIE